MCFGPIEKKTSIQSQVVQLLINHVWSFVSAGSGSEPEEHQQPEHWTAPFDTAWHVQDHLRRAQGSSWDPFCPGQLSLRDAELPRVPDCHHQLLPEAVKQQWPDPFARLGWKNISEDDQVHIRTRPPPAGTGHSHHSCWIRTASRELHLNAESWDNLPSCDNLT